MRDLQASRQKYIEALRYLPTARQLYVAAYRLMRKDVSFEQLWDLWPDAREITRAADYSYQAAVHSVSGWTNRRRRAKFFNGLAELNGEEWPF